jgi:hypothetical protein
MNILFRVISFVAFITTSMSLHAAIEQKAITPDAHEAPLVVERHSVASEQEFSALCPQLIPALVSTIEDFIHHQINYLRSYIMRMKSPVKRAKAEKDCEQILTECEHDLSIIASIKDLMSKKEYEQALETLRTHDFECPGYQLTYPGRKSLITIVKDKDGTVLAFTIRYTGPMEEEITEAAFASEARTRDLTNNVIGLMEDRNVEKLVREKILNEEVARLKTIKLNILDDAGYSPLHRFITRQDSCQKYYQQAIKNAVPCWTYKYGRSWCGSAHCSGSSDPVLVTWSANGLSKDEILEDNSRVLKMANAISAEIVKAYLDAGAQVDLPDSYGRTALWWAAERNQPGIMEVLLAAGANVNGACAQRPLEVAVVDGNKEAVEVLLAHKADLTISDEYNDISSAEECANEYH